jgi:hypothetical protein
VATDILKQIAYYKGGRPRYRRGLPLFFGERQSGSSKTPLNRVDKSYVTERLGRLYNNAESLLEQAISLGPASDVTVLELPAGGYYLISGNGHDLAAMQAEHGARSGWQVRNTPSSIVVSGRSGDCTCELKRDRPGNRLISALKDAPAYLLV